VKFPSNATKPADRNDDCGPHQSYGRFMRCSRSAFNNDKDIRQAGKDFSTLLHVRSGEQGRAVIPRQVSVRQHVKNIFPRIGAADTVECSPYQLTHTGYPAS